MKLSDIVADVKREIDNVSSSRHSDKDVARNVNLHIMSVVRKMGELDEGYHNHTVTIPASSATQRYSNEWRYELPSWVMKVVEVRKSSGSTEGRGEVYDKITKFDQTKLGWLFLTSRSLSLRGFSQATDLQIDVVKRPARLTLGTLPAQTGGTPTPSTTIVRLDLDSSADAGNYPHETEADAYVGCALEFTGVNAVGHEIGGQVRECIASQHLVNNGSGALHTLLTFDRPFSVAPAASDTYELHAQLGDEHIRLVELLAVRTMLATEQNSDGLRAIREELAEQWAVFIEHVQRRQIQMPHVMGEFYSKVGNQPYGYGFDY